MRYGWSLEKSAWEACLGVDGGWKKTTLNPIKRESVPPLPGVYAICTKPAVLQEDLFKILYNVIYVGQAKGGGGLRQRFLTHCKYPAPQLRKAKNCFGDELDYWFLVLDADDVPVVESRLIETLGPVVNLVGGVIEARLREPRPA